MKKLLFIIFTLFSIPAFSQGSLPLPYPYQNVGLPAGPVDFYYRKTVKSPYSNTPYTSLTQAKSILKPSVRYTGMTFFVMSSTDTTEYWMRRDTTWSHIEKKLSISSSAPGSTNQIIFNNSGTFSATRDLAYDSVNHRLIIGNGNTNNQGTDNFLLGLNSSIDIGSWNIVTGEDNHIQRPSGSNTVGDNGIFSGYQNYINTTSSNPFVGTFETVAVGGYDNVSNDATQGTLVGGNHNRLTLCRSCVTLGGEWGEAAGYGAFAHGLQDQAGHSITPAPTQRVLASGKNAFNFSMNNNWQTIGYGATAERSSILNTKNGNVACVGCASIGGYGLNVSSSYDSGTVAVSHLAIMRAPNIADTTGFLMGYRSSDGKAVRVHKSSISGLPSQTGNSGKFLTTNGTSASWGQVPLTSGVSGILSIANGGTGTSSPGISAGTNIGVTGSWPNQIVSISPGGSTHQVQINNGTGLSGISNNTSGFVLTSNGTGTDPTFQAAPGSVFAGATVYVDSVAGNDATGAVNRLDKPFLTINAALDAGASVKNLLVKIAPGTYATPTSSKIRSNLIIQGAGKPGYNSTVVATAYKTFTVTAPTRLRGGTILQGTLTITDKQNVKITDLGIDCGPDYVTAGGTEGNCLGMGSATSVAPFTLMKGMEIRNVACLGKNASSAFHCVVLENTYNPVLYNVDTYYAQHGLVIKGVGGNYSNFRATQHAGEGIIIKSDTYAWNAYTVISNFLIDNCGYGVDIYLGTGVPGNDHVLIADGIIRNVTKGVVAEIASGTPTTNNNALHVTGVKVITSSNHGFDIGAAQGFKISNCYVYSAGATGFYVHNLSNATWGVIENCTTVGATFNGFTYDATVGTVVANNNTAINCSWYGHSAITSNVVGCGNIGSNNTLGLQNGDIVCISQSTAPKIVTKTANYTVTISDHTVEGDTSSGNVTLTLPAASTTYFSSGYGEIFEFIKKSASNTLTVTDGTFSQSLTTDGQYLRVQSNGTTYKKLNN